MNDFVVPLAAWLALGLMLLPAPVVAAQSPPVQTADTTANAPYPVFDAVPAITMQPLVLDMSDTSVEIEWMTDAPADARVHYGEHALDREAVPQDDGLIPVGKVHRVILRGLEPGHAYRYQVVSRRVVRVRPYWPEMGRAIESNVHAFTTFASAKSEASFAFFTDTHEKMDRIQAMASAIKRQSVPLLYVRGNHENRGPYARSLGKYLHAQDGRYYYTRDDGPLHLVVVDTGEDKPDATNVYAGLNDMRDYKREERAWFAKVLASESRTRTAPFTVVLGHQPNWGWSYDGGKSTEMAGQNADWMRLANQAHVDLFIAGHVHAFEFIKPGEQGNDFPILVVGTGQVARVVATDQVLKVTVTDQDGHTIDSFTLDRKPKARSLP